MPSSHKIPQILMRKMLQQISTTKLIGQNLSSPQVNFNYQNQQSSLQQFPQTFDEIEHYAQEQLIQEIDDGSISEDYQNISSKNPDIISNQDSEELHDFDSNREKYPRNKIDQQNFHFFNPVYQSFVNELKDQFRNKQIDQTDYNSTIKKSVYAPIDIQAEMQKMATIDPQKLLFNQLILQSSAGIQFNQNQIQSQENVQFSVYDQKLKKQMNFTSKKQMMRYIENFKLNYKTDLCRNWMNDGNCEFENDCAYAHGPHELVNRPPPKNLNKNYKTKICKQWHEETPGECTYGEKCQFIHQEKTNVEIEGKKAQTKSLKLNSNIIKYGNQFFQPNKELIQNQFNQIDKFQNEKILDVMESIQSKNENQNDLNQLENQNENSVFLFSQIYFDQYQENTDEDDQKYSIGEQILKRKRLRIFKKITQKSQSSNGNDRSFDEDVNSPLINSFKINLQQLN